ncbi:unnamed protein product [Rhizophagus irregularis]|nr:unnamed protein product [Rhizophagus irregularis]
MISPYNNVAEMAFVIYVLNSLPSESSVTFVSSHQFANLYSRWCNASSIRRTRLKNNSLWSCISEILRSRRIFCSFISFPKDSAPIYFVRALDLLKERGWPDSLQPVLLNGKIFPLSLQTMGLFTGYDELLTQDPIKLSQRFSSLYADDSLCPNCGIFMETLKHLFICSSNPLDFDDNNSALIDHKDITTTLVNRFLVKLATKVFFSTRCKETYKELLTALRNIPALGLPELLLNHNYSSFSASWFLRGFSRDLLTCLMYRSRLSYKLISPIISRTFLKLQREIYHGLWRLRCKLKVANNAAKDILPSTLRLYKGPSVRSKCYSVLSRCVSFSASDFRMVLYWYQLAPFFLNSAQIMVSSPVRFSEESNSPHLK